MTFRVAEMAESNGATHVDMLHPDLIWRDLKVASSRVISSTGRVPRPSPLHVQNSSSSTCSPSRSPLPPPFLPSSPLPSQRQRRTTVDDESAEYWKQNLYLLQERAPKPRVVSSPHSVEGCPPQYGREFHGFIDRPVADSMLTTVGEGAYLVRSSKRCPDAYTLCMFFDGRVFNYKLYFDGHFFVGEKRFDSMELLVADGLISMYMDKHAADYIQRMADEAIYEQSPYLQYQSAVDKPAKPRSDPRTHSFQSHTFRMIQFCDFCRNFLWGYVQQGVRCEDCGFAAHKKCAERCIPDCRPDSKYVKRMFGVDLTTFYLAHGTPVPPVVNSAIREVELRGLDVEGIYRVSGSHDQMEKLSKQFDTNHNVDLAMVEDIHTVCGLLKLYLRRLPQQLVPLSVYKALLSAFTINHANTNEKIRACRKALDGLSEANTTTFHMLLMHLSRVAERADENKMTVENLATIFSPTVFYTGVLPCLPQQQHMLLHFLISNPRIVAPS
ncbi:hypothetical protein PENTCL1PPCAC_11273 [Pristionchus entomophagus]|uniref:Beta-chimaerin n=1 Tax=Pristionchus entomophagus TaxID=358040 RepID=A0AAV5T8F0_9BILA|nr:hypothetical protein PENTCL1PPCAC_11273 [Pristionchus entomophagus]